MDLLTDLLHSLHPRGAGFWRTRVAAPWGMSLPVGDAAYHVVLDGACVLSVDGEAEVALGPGDFVLLPRGHAHVLRDAPGSAAPPLAEALASRTPGPCTPGPRAPEPRTPEPRTPEPRASGPHAPEAAPCVPGTARSAAAPTGAATLVCGTVAFERATTHPLLTALPPVIVVRAGERAGVPWLEASLGFLACEATSERAGATAVVGHLASVLFIQAVRAHLGQTGETGETGPGVLRAMRDDRLGAALAAVHAAPEHPWTVDALAREAALGRTVFAARFREAVGEPPLAYVTRWRMHRAASLLRGDTRLPLADVAARVGYESEAAFHRTFTRWMHATPARFRRTAA